MLKESATGIRALDCVGDKIVAKEKKYGGKQRKKNRGSAGDKSKQKLKEMAVGAADAYIYLKQTIDTIPKGYA